MSVSDIKNMRLVFRDGPNDIVPKYTGDNIYYQSKEVAIWLAARGIHKNCIKFEHRQDPDVFRYWPNDARFHAQHVVKGRWIPGEIVIMENPEVAYEYACFVLQARWISLGPEFSKVEHTISRNPQFAYAYSRHVIKGILPEYELDALLQDVYWTYWYALDIVKVRWPLCEPIIATNPWWSYIYIRDVIKQDLPPESSPCHRAIATDACSSYKFAKHVIVYRWPAGEAAIGGSEKYSKKYEALFPLN